MVVLEMISKKMYVGYNSNNILGSWIGMLIAVLVITGVEIRVGHTQTSLQAITDRVTELEGKLADAKARQEKAQSVQKQLEQQEQKLIKLEQYLSESDKYRVQVIEIRMNIKSIYAKIEAIIKEKNDFEHNLQLAKNLQAMLRDEQKILKPYTNDHPDLVSRKTPCGTLTINKPNSWRIGNVLINDRINYEDSNEIRSIFISGRYIDQDDILNCAYQLYENQGLVLHFILHSKGANIVDLDILFDRREPRGSNYDYNARIFNTYKRVQTLNEFKTNDFRITVK